MLSKYFLVRVLVAFIYIIFYKKATYVDDMLYFNLFKKLGVEKTELIIFLNHGGLNMASKTLKKYFSLPLEIYYLFTLLLILSYHSLRKKYHTLCFKFKIFIKTISSSFSFVAICCLRYLLLLSGDIQINPGPKSKNSKEFFL